MKDILYCFGFKDNYEFKDKSTNYTKPLLIPKGTDTWEHIGLQPMTIEEVSILSRTIKKNILYYIEK